VTFQTTLSAIPQTVVGRKCSGLTSTQTSQARPEAWMKTLSTMYARPNVGVMALTYSSTFHMPSLFTQMITQIHSKILQNSNKFIINSNKLG